jgi:hypothetical protein
MATPTLMSTPIIDGNTHAHALPMIIDPHQCFYLSRFDINGKGYISLGLLPLTEISPGMLPLSALSFGMFSMHLMNLSPFDKDITLMQC